MGLQPAWSHLSSLNVSDEGFSHHAKSRSSGMTALQQGHFFQPINHTLDVSIAITARGLIPKVFPVAPPSPPFSASFLLNCNLSLVPPKNLYPYCSGIRNHIRPSGCYWGQSGFLEQHVSIQYSHLYFLS